MTQMRNCVEKLASEISARPAGTDEEQSAAIYIHDEFQSNTDLEVETEEFHTSFFGEMFRSISAGIVFLAGLLAILFPPSLIAALVLALVGTVLFVLDSLSIFKLSSFIGKSPTQNVVAKYIPQGDSGQRHRSRKIVLITNYDSERMRPEVASSFYKQLGNVKLAEIICCILVFLVLLLNLLIGSNLFFTILLIIGCIGSALPLICYIFHITAQYNDGANNNAASVAVMLDVARRISSGVFVPSSDRPVIHGEDIANRAGVIPYEAEVEWQAPVTEQQESDDVSDSTTQMPANEEPEYTAPSISVSQEMITTPVAYVEEKASSGAQSSGPDWFNRGKAKANGGQAEVSNPTNVKRSAFGDALEMANNLNATTQNVIAADASSEAEPKSDLEKRLEAIHNNIEIASSDAIARAQDDVDAAERVLENEIAEQQRQERHYEEETTDVADAIPVIAAEREPEITLRDPNATVEHPVAEETELVEPIRTTADQEATVLIEPVRETRAAERRPKPANKSARSAIDDRLAARNEAAPSATKHVQNAKRDIQLPSLTGAIEAQNKEKQNQEKADREKTRIQERDEKLGITVPSLDSSNAQSHTKQKNTKVSQAGAFGVGEATGTFAPITDDLVAGLSEEETYVLDADDTIFEEQTTESGAVAGPGYVDIPETRTESVFGKIFNRKKKKSEQEISFREAYNVDEDFDAREVGKKRGDWESFAPDDDEFNGGMVISCAESTTVDAGQTRDDIYAFAEQGINHEVWCVALGAEYADHAGSKKFFETHKDELKGSIFIVLDGLGAGTTTLVEREGIIKRKSISPRMKRIVRSSAKTVGIDLDSTSMTWTESIGACVATEGFSFIHIAGCEGGKPAMLSHKDDSAEFVDDEALSENANLIMEIVRSI